MGLDKLTIKTDYEKEFKVSYNPERYTVTKSVQFAEVTIPGLESPVQQFVRGQAEKVTFELHFDTTAHGMLDDVKDVRTETAAIYDLLKVRKKTHAPPRCKLTWGKGQIFSFGAGINPWCVLESVSEEFTLFSPGGVPLRAKLTVTFREAWTVEEQIAEIAKHSPERTKVKTLATGKTLSHLAAEEYGDPGLWRPIAEDPANNIDNPRAVAPGTVLQVPRLTGRSR
jgi:hypothetical protein